MKTTVIVAALVVAVLAGAGIYFLRDLSAPLLTLVPADGPVSGRREVTLKLADPGAGLRSLRVEVQQGEHRAAVVAKEYPAGSHQAREVFRLGDAGLKEGPFKLLISASDRSPMHFGAGNRSEASHAFDYQNRPPAVSALSVAHNIARGGAGLVVYTANRELERSGVSFADRFFPGYRQSGDLYACLFAFPFNQPVESFVPRVLAVDRAGNERLTGIYFHLLPKNFPSDRIELSDAFLEKIAADFKDRFPQAATPLEVFLKANRELRVHDAKILADCGRKTSPVPLWEGAFLRLPNSAPRGSFAQLRSYYYHGAQVDQQTHLGIDLAALAHAQVPAANTGKVVWAEDLGIYGQCVIIDHGLGLQSLYGHLSRITVKVGDAVRKGQVIGNTGDTGLAGGDHLHFGMVVSGEQVNPIEWWDPSWIKNNVTGKLAAAKTGAASP